MLAETREASPIETEQQEVRVTRRRPQTTKPIKHPHKDDRLDLRAESEIKQRWQRAADLLGVPLSAFAKVTLTERADRIIAEHESMTLGREESIWFINFLMAPPREPTEKMRQAKDARHRLLGE